MRDRHDDSTGDMFGGGREAKRAGMRLVRDNESERWKALYRRYAHEFLASLPLWAEFQGENLRAYVVQRIGRPHHQNVWGAMFNSVTRPWLEKGYIVATGDVAPAQARRSHAHMFRTYKKVAHAT